MSTNELNEVLENLLSEYNKCKDNIQKETQRLFKLNNLKRSIELRTNPQIKYYYRKNNIVGKLYLRIDKNNYEYLNVYIGKKEDYKGLDDREVINIGKNKMIKLLEKKHPLNLSQLYIF